MDESNIPIDINTNKLLDWLISRRHVSKDWQNNILKIREKINAAIQDMPAHDGIVKLLSGQHINYFHCVKIVEILKETEADTKNLFGRYGSQRMKDWLDILSCYQQENIYLGEAAQLLMRNVSYEVPSLKKQIAKCEQAQLDSEKKIKDCTRAENITTNDFNSTCKQLGIKGKDIKVELLELPKELPMIYSKMDFGELLDGINMYKTFVNYHTGKEDQLTVLPILAYLITHGNTTTYEYTYGEKPVSIEDPSDVEASGRNGDQAERESANIDFGDDVQIDFASLSTAKEIDFGDSPLSEGDIDWGNTSTTEEEFEIVDMDISLEESGIVVENSGLDGGVARGTDAHTILDNPKTRDQVINDLMELNAFLRMRLYEMANGGDMMMLDGPNALKMQTIEGVTSLADHVSIALEGLTNKRIMHLHNIKHSPKYVDMLSAALKQKLDVVGRMAASKRVVEEKMAENAKEIRKTAPLIKQIIEKTKVLQREIEADVSKKYKGRVVNIVGGVNQM